jgi:hypothetical protein
MYAKSAELLGSYNPALECMIILMALTAIMFACMGKYDKHRAKFS